MSDAASTKPDADIDRWEGPDFAVSGSVASPGMSIRQLELLQQQAYDEAYAAGLEQGLKAGQQQSLQAAQRLAGMVNQLAQPFAALDDCVERQLVQLALVVARHIIRRELKTEPAHVIGAVRDALAALPIASRDVRVRLHPDDAELVRSLLKPADGDLAWTIEEDPVLTRGGCRVESEFSHIDARIESRMSTLVATLLGDERDAPRTTDVGTRPSVATGTPADSENQAPSFPGHTDQSTPDD
ncbi:MAG: flagellar assembly protein FliH [Pseudomonadota bacterium]